MTDRLDGWRRRRAAKRVKPGDGRPLKPFRWWQLLTRSLFFLRLPGEAVYAVDVRHLGDATSGEVEAHLYLDGGLVAESRVPARFPVPGGAVEVAASNFGLKRCHYVPEKGDERQLTPDPASAEGRRERLERNHPVASRWVGTVSVVVLVFGLVVLVPQVVETLSQIEIVTRSLGEFSSPIRLPAWLNTATLVATVAASTERALRMRHHWLLDGAAG
jgi:hypothetical protein